MKTPKLVLTCALALASIIFVLFRAKSEEPPPGTFEPKPDLAILTDWADMEASMRETFHVETHGLVYGVLDGLYILPTQDQLDRIEKFRRRMADGGKFMDEAKDCDDFAREATYLAKRWSYRYFETVPASVAYGSVYVRVNGYYSLMSGGTGWYEGYHVLNVYRRNDGQWFFFEPQTGKSEPVESMIYEGVLTVVRVEI